MQFKKLYLSHKKTFLNNHVITWKTSQDRKGRGLTAAIGGECHVERGSRVELWFGFDLAAAISWADHLVSEPEERRGGGVPPQRASLFVVTHAGFSFPFALMSRRLGLRIILCDQLGLRFPPGRELTNQALLVRLGEDGERNLARER